VTTLTHLIHGAADSASITGLVYVGTISLTALIAIAAPTDERRRDARAVLKLILRARRRD